jgi:hypothetical protein
MPDLLTHILVLTPLRKKLTASLALVLIGTILPDTLGRISVVLPFSPVLTWVDFAAHTPLSMGLLIYILALAFPEDERKRTFALLTLGTGIHFGLDLLQRTATFGIPWFFPFSFSSFWIPLLWSDESVWAIPPLLIVNLLVYVRSRGEPSRRKWTPGQSPGPPPPSNAGRRKR